MGWHWAVAQEALQGPLLAQPWLHPVQKPSRAAPSHSTLSFPTDPSLGRVWSEYGRSSSLDPPAGHSGPGPALSVGPRVPTSHVHTRAGAM